MKPLRQSPTAVTLAVIAGVFLVQQAAGVVTAPRSLFALSPPLFSRPWTIVTSVYAHAGPSHLLANAVGVALAGVVLERRTTQLRFHAFFASTGALAGVSQVSMTSLVGPLVPGMVSHASVLGASGAVFALFGYLLAANRLTDTVVGGFELAPRLQLALAGVAAAAITLATANPGVALIAHFTGLLLGFLSGRVHLLRPRDSPEPPAAANY
ncbi:rhomboid family intramembrane serine protease [Haloarcula sp. 1CSR25-25]|uniref:rhomboid family intramembrane serine protease n=1 Tax=Haloarcula sp. 1CSR25-25 TaxID=2862545 RepID=UPI002894AEE1|nr:rhomboid family intramembrane serine protease [Haloarcula sp. 1CSR25-25]MDT3433950.1 rhomboid family intramembrane serine protease [Haloarcula sp. 1CSR25-25]